MAARGGKKVASVRSNGPVGAEGFSALLGEMRAALASEARDVRVDLANAQSIDGACLALLISAASGLGQGRTMSVVTSPPIHHSLRDWRLDSVLTLVEADASDAAMKGPDQCS